MSDDLFPTFHYRVHHTFPHSRLTTQVSRARERYSCDSMRTHRDHVESIGPGSLYLYVRIWPEERRPRRVRPVRLCAGCACAYGLAARFAIDGVTGDPGKSVGAPPKRYRTRYA